MKYSIILVIVVTACGMDTAKELPYPYDSMLIEGLAFISAFTNTNVAYG